MGRLEGRVAIVTGASGALGGAIARALAAEGAAVIAHYARNADAAAVLVDAIRRGGGRAEAVQANLERPEGAADLVASAQRSFGGLHILVNNAGITRDMLVLRMKEEDWQAVINTNLSSAFYCIKAALREFLRQRSGRIINITSVAGQIGTVGQANYAASKAGLIGLTRAVAREVASRGITVNAVAPGFVEVGLTERLPPDVVRSYLEQVPLGRAGKPEEVAAAVVFLASDDAAYITGQVLNVDGGLVMR
ncbi:MAG: 3-oxoacyl-[acyl-carrier-protein] reductase [Armatimonadota bacterium]|nr:3-oxoacyl-[acyl-carrier-protein] reductase [Armatimonadota bacterium]MDR7450289.1 3-oxoacyl-[acyl-carrier-protein] reductase [Armatimonadota bacterium]MDR7467128.1 3-oxoacyl-[acyl-carrier-protein] reductase [Armatimonadota bacterium]MDR7493330.1 3-oxoacyl-[acyl-carrier-protein] reductase [Armatimonadota bacterium]MDR7499338.1 3-oxoacyl-[acyl-carrier-protein] reductase [Armatimonadota bacterium]